MVLHAANQTGGNWTRSPEHEHAPEMPIRAWWFYVACKEGACRGMDPLLVPRVVSEHGLDERKDCTDERCERNARRVDRARGFALVGRLAQRPERE